MKFLLGLVTTFGWWQSFRRTSAGQPRVWSPEANLQMTVLSVVWKAWYDTDCGMNLSVLCGKVVKWKVLVSDHRSYKQIWHTPQGKQVSGLIPNELTFTKSIIKIS